jgi:hypothetical protein
MSNSALTRIRTYALAIVAVCFIGSQASAQGPRVTVDNTPLPVTVTNPQGAGTPVAFTLQVSQGGIPASFTVPAAQRLVIEYLSGGCTTGLIPPQVAFTAVTSGVSNNHFFAFPFNPSVTTYQFGHLVKVYADAGTAVTLVVFAGSPAPVGCVLTFSGLLVNSP